VTNSRQKEITLPSHNCVVVFLKVRQFPFAVKPNKLCKHAISMHYGNVTLML